MFVTSSLSNKHVEQSYFVDKIQLKELCIVLKELTAVFVRVWQNITLFIINGHFLHTRLSKLFVQCVLSRMRENCKIQVSITYIFDQL